MVKKRYYTEESLSLAWDRVEVFYGEFFLHDLRGKKILWLKGIIEKCEACFYSTFFKHVFFG